MNARLFAISAAALILLAVINLIRKQKMTFKYSIVWLSTSATVLFLSIYEKALFHLSEWAGFELPSNFVFFLLLMFSTFLSLFLTIYINEQNNRTESLCQAIALLEQELKELKKERDLKS